MAGPDSPDSKIPAEELPIQVSEQLPPEQEAAPDLVPRLLPEQEAAPDLLPDPMPDQGPDTVPVPGPKNCCTTHRQYWIALSLLLLIGAVVGIIIGVTSPVSASQSLCQVGSDLDGEAAHDWFGTSVALSSDGNRVVIGAPSGYYGYKAGYVRTYDWSESGWVQAGSDIDGESSNDYFGQSVALSSDGNRVAIGALNNDGTGQSAGHVRIFDWSESQWIQVGSDLDGEAADDLFGVSVALSSDGNLVAIGATGYWGDIAGYVRIFDWSESNWTQVGSDLDGEAAGDNFGESVALSGDGSRVAIGAPFNDGNGDAAGQVRIYDWSVSEWIRVGSYLDGEAVDNYFGTSVALSSDGNRVAIGAPGSFDSGNAGYVRIFDWSGSEWIQVGSDFDGEAAGDYFGENVALSSDGNRVAVGARFNDGNGHSAGHVRIYDWSGNEWIQVGSDLYGEPDDYFGSSVALSSEGNLVAIGAEQQNATDGTGYVRIFGLEASSCASTLSNGQTTSPSPDPDPTSPSTPSPNASSASQSFCQVGSDLDGEVADDYFGYSVALSSDGNRVAIGAPDNSGNAYNAGHVRIFDLSGGEWVQVGSDLDGEERGDSSGGSVALSGDGNRVAIGASWANYRYAGQVRIFDWSGSEWIQVGSDLYGEAYVGFGYSVALSSDGNRVVVGAYSNDGYGDDAGHVSIFDWSGSKWIHVSDLDGEAANDYFGTSLALSADGNRVAIGAYGNDGNGVDAGHVRIFDWSVSEWIRVGSDLDGKAVDNYFGTSVALSSDGNRVAIGAPCSFDSGNAGYVRIFDWSGSEWIQVGSDLDGEAAGDWFGSSVALSADGNRVAIGAFYNDANGENAGHVRIYDWSGSEWIQVGSDLDGEAGGDQSGTSVALSSDGSRVAIGAIAHDGSGGNDRSAGQVRIFDLEASSCL